MANNPKINWGILSTGAMANNMALALAHVEDANLLAVASRSENSSKKFAKKHNIARNYENYEELTQDSDIDLVYIATPHACHYENMLLALNNNKNVLCEKPFTLNHAQALEVIELARKKNLFLMEAHWSEFLPGIKKVKSLITENAIGKPLILKANFCVKSGLPDTHRAFNLELGGGSLLDIGVYPVSLALSLFGYPVEILSDTIIGRTNVDIFNTMMFKHNNNVTSFLTCGLNAAQPMEAEIIGEDGYIKLHEPFFQPKQITVQLKGEEQPVHLDVSFVGNGYNYEAAAVNRCIKNSEKQCSEFSLDKTLEILKITDSILNKGYKLC